MRRGERDTQQYTYLLVESSIMLYSIIADYKNEYKYIFLKKFNNMLG